MYNNNNSKMYKGVTCFMKHIQTLETRDMAKSLLNGGCGECQTSLPERLQDQLRHCQPALREDRQVIFAGFDAGMPWQPGIFYDTNGAAGAYRMRPYRDAVGADSISAPWPSGRIAL